MSIQQESKENPSVGRIDEEFLKALKSDDIVVQYELLNLAANNRDLADALVATVDKHLVGDQEPAAIDWEGILIRSSRVRWSSWFVRGVVAGRAWTAALLLVAIISTAGSAVFLRDAVQMPIGDSAFRGTFFLGVLCLVLMVLSGVTLTTVRPRLLQRRISSLWEPIVVLPACIAGMAAVAAIVLAFLWWPNPGLWTGKVSPGDPFTVRIPKDSDVVTVTASDPHVEFILRIYDKSGREVSKVKAEGYARERLTKYRPNDLKAEVSANHFTNIAVSTFPLRSNK